MAPADRAKNSLKTARLIRNLGSSQHFTDQVGSADPDDLYRLKLGSSSSLTLQARGSTRGSTRGSRRSALRLFSLKQPSKALRKIGRTDFSDLTRQQILQYVNPLAASRLSRQPISLTLAAGIYYLRVSQAQGNSRYRLKLTVNPVFPIDPALPPGSAPAPGTTPPGASPIPSPVPAPTFALAAFPTQTWLRQFGTAQNDYAFGTALDSNRLYVAGVTSSGSAFSGSGFVSQYAQDGGSIGRQSLSIPGSVAVADVAVDDSGNYYVVGATISGTNSDGFVAKYNAAGERQWLNTIRSSVSVFDAADAAAAVFIDNNNNIYVTGVRRGFPAPFSQGSAFVAKYASNGSLETSFGNSGFIDFGNAKTTAASDITVADGKIYITGITDATLNLSGGSSVNLAGGDAFVASFDRMAGNLLWNQTLSSGSGTDYGRGLAVSGSDLYIVGQTAGALPSGSLATNAYGGGESDGFLAKYTVSGNSGSLQWTKQIGGSGLDAAQAIAIDPTGKIYLAGETNTSLFGAALGSSDAWIAQADASGNLLSASQLGTAQDDEAYSLVTDAAGAIYLAGQTQGSFAAANLGNYDVWLAKYGA